MILSVVRLLGTVILAFLAGKLISKLKLPSILGWLIAGMILGPHALSFISNDLLDAVWYKSIVVYCVFLYSGNCSGKSFSREFVCIYHSSCCYFAFGNRCCDRIIGRCCAEKRKQYTINFDISYDFNFIGFKLGILGKLFIA